MKTMKKLLTVFLSIAILFVLSACNKEEETVIPPYSGILTKMRLGMPESRVVAMQPETSDLYYQTGNDYIMWTVNSDTEIQSLRDVIPPDDLYYYCDDSIITYYLKDNDDKTEKILDGYMQEVSCVVPRSIAVEFYNAEVAYLNQKYGVESKGTRTGAEGVDLELHFKEELVKESFTVTFQATFTSQTVNGINDYYGTHFSLTLMGNETSAEMPISSGEMTLPVTEKTKATEAETTTAAETEAAASSEDTTAAE